MPLKQKLVLIIGILYILNGLITDIENIVHNYPLDYILSTAIQYNAMALAMILATFRKKTPALVLTILAVVMCLVNQYILTYGEVDPFYRTLYYMLEYILMGAYILAGDRKKDSLLWCGIFLFAVAYSVYEIAHYYLSLRDLVFLILYLGFYLLGYSPDKWYERKKIPENTNA